MGVLDDAIREHLELKRRHGASDEEVQGQEREALGATGRKPMAEQREEEPAAATETEPDQAPPAAPDAEDVEPDAEHAEPEPTEPESPAGDTPARGFDEVADAPLPAEDAGEEDVLEETPEFLQDAPEHDRLWFEQKPPRDFDFDE